MTKEVALRKVKGYLTDYFSITDYDELEEIMLALDQQPCEDCVSRAQALNEINKKVLCYTYEAREIVENLPPVTPQRPKGKWILYHPLQADDPGAYRCSVCGYGDWGLDPKIDNFCFNCGADMRGDNE